MRYLKSDNDDNKTTGLIEYKTGYPREVLSRTQENCTTKLEILQRSSGHQRDEGVTLVHKEGEFL